MELVVVVQARLNSSRLPGKSLLPICGLPLAVLAARRAASAGRDVILATSSEHSDDEIARVAESHGVQVFRGALNDVLSRFVAALAPYGDETLVARLTADNAVPDGALIEEVKDEFLHRGLDYIITTGNQSCLPVGVTVEMTRVRHLRMANACAVSDYDHEHVMPYVSRKFGAERFSKYADRKIGHHRMTIDCLDDYLSIVKIFAGVEDPVQVPWMDLLNRVQEGLYQPLPAGPATGFVLDAAPLARGSGALSDAERSRIVKTAIGYGVSGIATARGPGEDVIGRVLATGWQGRCPVITKLSPLSEIPPGAPAEMAGLAVERDVVRSCRALRAQKLDTVLLDRAALWNPWQGAAWKMLRELRDEGLIGSLGISLQSPEELPDVLEDRDVRHIQVACNLLDWRWDGLIDRLRAARSERDLTVHVRNISLEGLLCSNRPEDWARAHVPDPKPIVTWMRDWARAFGRANVADLCLAWAKGLDWIDGIVIGAETAAQLRENLVLFQAEGLDGQQISEMLATRPRLGMESLDSARWKK